MSVHILSSCAKARPGHHWSIMPGTRQDTSPSRIKLTLSQPLFNLSLLSSTQGSLSFIQDLSHSLKFLKWEIPCVEINFLFLYMTNRLNQFLLLLQIFAHGHFDTITITGWHNCIHEQTNKLLTGLHTMVNINYKHVHNLYHLNKLTHLFTPQFMYSWNLTGSHTCSWSLTSWHTCLQKV